ncbi:MAG: glycosyltransferase [Verrucomicrobiota bacterium]
MESITALLVSLISTLYLVLALTLALYAFHSYVILAVMLLYRRVRNRELIGEESRVRGWLEQFLEWPAVVTQLPIYNEAHVAPRVIEAAARMHYPKHRHRVQVLDDSTDHTVGIIDETVARLDHLRQEGQTIAPIEVIRRRRRQGFKAGALAHGLKTIKEEFVAVFDADFIPSEDFLEKSIPHFFLKEHVGFVQGRWAFVNQEVSALTWAQGVGLDSHFAIEQAARSAHPKTFMNFNGTAGVWRVEAIEGAGGWSAATLTEDLDLSYRAQLEGWNGVYLQNLPVPCELPASFSAYKSQQFRWAKGSMQTAIRLLPRIFRSSLSWKAKVEAFFHLTHYSVHPLLLLVVLFTPPVLFSGGALRGAEWAGLVLVAASLAPVFFYSVGQACLHCDWLKRLIFLPALTLAGMGLAAANARAIFEAFLGRETEFVRTPKQGDANRSMYRVRFPVLPELEIGLGIYALVGVVFALRLGNWGAAQFGFLAACAFLYMGIFSFGEKRTARTSA